MIETLSLARAQASTPERITYIRTVPRRRRPSLLRRLARWMAGRPAEKGGCCA